MSKIRPYTRAGHSASEALAWVVHFSLYIGWTTWTTLQVIERVIRNAFSQMVKWFKVVQPTLARMNQFDKTGDS
jgi:hypothetical protein